jgi:hypothetical protein
MSVKIAVINLMDGSPDPYNLNDAMVHINDASHPHIPIAFDWTNFTESDRPSHYVVHADNIDRRLGRDVHAMVPIIAEALKLTTAYAEYAPDIMVTQTNSGIVAVDTDVDPGEVKFILDGYSNIWIHAIWRD